MSPDSVLENEHVLAHRGKVLYRYISSVPQARKYLISHLPWDETDLYLPQWTWTFRLSHCPAPLGLQNNQKASTLTLQKTWASVSHFILSLFPSAFCLVWWVCVCGVWCGVVGVRGVCVCVCCGVRGVRVCVCACVCGVCVCALCGRGVRVCVCGTVWLQLFILKRRNRYERLTSVSSSVDFEQRDNVRHLSITHLAPPPHSIYIHKLIILSARMQLKWSKGTLNTL